MPNLNNLLSVEHKAEYVVIDGKPRRRKLSTAFIFVLFSAGVIAIVLFWLKQEDAVRTYPEDPLPAVGLSASLKVKWLEGGLHYRFTLVPLPSKEDQFRLTLETAKPKEIKFHIHLVDKDGFELCSADPDLHRHLGVSGQPDALDAEQTFLSCTKRQFESVTRFRVTGNYPTAPASRDSPLTVQDAGLVPTSKLTGRDFTSGEIETLDHGSFQTTKRAEYMTLLGWEPPDQIKITCTGKLCVLTDLRTLESVHAVAK